MTDFVSRELGVPHNAANRLRKRFWAQYGTTLSGLMHEHAVDPGPFLAEVHDIDLSALAPSPGLAGALCALPGRRIIYTNGSRRHGERVSEALGIDHAFDAIYGIEDADFLPKPNAEAFRRVFSADGLSPSGAAIFEDEARNLEVPHKLDMHTVLVGAANKANHVHYQTTDLAKFLTRLV